MTGNGHEEQVTSLLGGGLLSERLRGGHEGYGPGVAGDDRSEVHEVGLGPATQVEMEGGEVRFLVPFARHWPDENWLRAFRRARLVWPSHLREPLIEEGRGLRIGPIPAGELEQHVRAVKEKVAAANRIYVDEIEPELRRQQEEALQREREEHRLRSEVESKLKLLLG